MMKYMVESPTLLWVGCSAHPAGPQVEAMARSKHRARRVHGEIREDPAGAFQQVYALVRLIPEGRVMTYGQIATFLESNLSPRAVGWAMAKSPEGVPWQRVVNASGGCSTRRRPDMPPDLQQRLLEKEGVRFDSGDALDLDRYRWTPEESETS